MKNKMIILVKNILLVVLITVVCCGCSKQEEMLISLEEQTQENSTISQEQENEESKEEEAGKSEKMDLESAKPQSVMVYVCGAVNNPGVYELSENSRLYEAIQLAGGLQKDAAPESINQARLLVDEEQIYIPTKSEVAEGKSPMLTEVKSDINSMNSTMTEDQKNGMINLNTASLAELTSLSGIGENKAKAIISYREEVGSFSNIEDIMQVDGIGEGVYKKIKEFIIVQ